MKRLAKKLKQNRAFTLMEVLIAVAIMVILLSISMPAITESAKGLEMSELDNHAKTIFLEAQNQIVSKRVSGSLSEFCKKVKEVGHERSGFYALTGDKNEMQELIIPASGVNQLPGKYLIELDVQTGEIYNVFYWESEASYSDVVGLLPQFFNNTADRKESKIGYYGGLLSGGTQEDTLGNTSASVVDLKQQVEVINDEELYIKMTFDLSDLTDKALLNIKYTVTDNEGNILLEGTKNGNDLFVNGIHEYTGYILLDSLIEDKSFSAMNASMSEPLVVGEDVVVKVESKYTEGNYKHDTTIKVNSAFKECKTNGGNTVITISSLRHLLNLKNYVPTGATTIKLIDTIDFTASNYDWKLEGGNVVFSEGEVCPITEIQPISNTALFSNAVIDGGNHKLQNFVINAVSDNAGIFAEVTDTEIKNIRIENITVKADAYSNVGGLVGLATGGSITNCGLYLTDGAYYTLNDGSYQIIGANNVGGLVGKTNNTNITKCFTAQKVEGGVAGSFAIGGLVGSIIGGSVQNSYASGDVKADIKAGGFFGTASGVNVKDVYTTGNVYASNTVGGFVGESANSTYQNAASYGRVLNNAGNAVPTSEAGGFAGIISSDNVSGAIYLKQNTYNDASSFNDAGIPKTYQECLADRASTASIRSFPYNGANEAFPFKTIGLAEHYGNWPNSFMLNNILVYYEKYATKQADDTYTYEYGYYTTTKLSTLDDGVVNGEWVLDTLQDKPCIEDGYALISMYQLKNIQFALNNVELLPIETLPFLDSVTPVSLDFELKDSGVSQTVNGVYIYELPFELQGMSAASGNDIEALVRTNGFYDLLMIVSAKAQGVNDSHIITGQNFYYCPHFAKMAVNNGEEAPNTPSTISVRSPRQLNALGKNSIYWSNSNGKINFAQETELDFSNYAVDEIYGKNYNITSSTINKPIGDEIQAFQHNYDGQRNRIIDYCLESGNQYTGLFGAIENATIQNVVMIASEPPKMANDDKGFIYSQNVPSESGVNAVGALVGFADANSTINNCAVAGYWVAYSMDDIADTTYGGISVGGLAGYSAGSITNCSAANEIEMRASDTTSAYKYSINVGGLAGSAADVASSYSGGGITIDNSAVGKMGFSTNLAGAVATGNGTYKDIYSYTDVNKVSNMTGYTYYGVVNEGTVEKCYYLDRGETHYTNVANANKKNYLELKNTALFPSEAGFGTVTAESTNPIDSKLEGKAYPFLAIIRDKDGNLVEYGDWQMDLNYVAEAYPVYYEKYQTSTGTEYGYYYCIKENGTVTVVDTLLTGEALKSGNVTISEAGYWEYQICDDQSVEDNVGDNIDTIDGYKYSLQTDSSKFYFKGTDSKYAAQKVEYKIIGIDKNTSQVYHDESSGTMDLYLNTNFAAAIKTEEFGTIEDNPLKVRYHEQLKSIDGLQTLIKDGEDKSVDKVFIRQDYHLELQDGNQPVTLGSNITYNGNSNEYKIKKYTHPIFKENNGTIQNCNVEGAATSAYDFGTEIGTAAVAFIGRNNGTIQNCTVTGTADSKTINGQNAYGFAVTNNGSITQCYVTGNVVIEGTDVAVGFVGTNSGNLTQCYVTVTRDSNVKIAIGTKQGTSVAAGFVGTNSGSILNCGVYGENAYDDITISANTAYGFVAQNNYTTGLAYAIKNGFVAGTVTGQEEAAGFAGTSNGLITLSYANTIVSANSSSNKKAAGFVLSSPAINGSPSVTMCYSAGSVQAYTVYGFMNTGNASECYTIAEMKGNNRSNTYGFASKGATVKECYWGFDEKQNFNDPESEISDNGAGMGTSLRGINSQSDYALPVAAKPYNKALGEEYLYPSVGITHYGDWLVYSIAEPGTYIESSLNGGTLGLTYYLGTFYFEKYENGTYGIYAIGQRSVFAWAGVEELINTLADSEVPVVESGYGVFYRGNLSGANWKISTLDGEMKEYTYFAQHNLGEIDRNKIGGNIHSGYHFYIETFDTSEPYRKRMTRSATLLSWEELDLRHEINPDNVGRPE